MKTREEAVRDYWVNKLEMAEPKYVAFGAFEWFDKGHVAGIEWLESQVSEKFQDWFLKNLGKPTSKVEFAEMAWQAAKLSAQKDIAEKDAEIERLKKRIVELDYCQKAFYEATKKVGW